MFLYQLIQSPCSCRSFIHNSYIGRYPDIAVFQPVINGVAGNLVGIQACMTRS